MFFGLRQAKTIMFTYKSIYTTILSITVNDMLEILKIFRDQRKSQNFGKMY